MCMSLSEIIATKEDPQYEWNIGEMDYDTLGPCLRIWKKPTGLLKTLKSFTLVCLIRPEDNEWKILGLDDLHREQREKYVEEQAKRSRERRGLCNSPKSDVVLP